MKKPFKKSTDKEIIEFLRSSIIKTTEDHGCPCMCLLCEALTFSGMAMMGEINLKTGQRKS